ncbi:hypothetical protein KQX54_008526 [Cotesia glomerata]|uniref:Uncharacterized protein n=1 Tax=Cotesia glomerata TaxID=32391 RepID=A0AAV7IR79_COTGL|nr:hypothetical protein KQX54_008526 [Cotesia glomerata]
MRPRRCFITSTIVKFAALPSVRDCCSARSALLLLSYPSPCKTRGVAHRPHSYPRPRPEPPRRYPASGASKELIYPVRDNRLAPSDCEQYKPSYRSISALDASWLHYGLRTEISSASSYISSFPIQEVLVPLSYPYRPYPTALYPALNPPRNPGSIAPV